MKKIVFSLALLATSPMAISHVGDSEAPMDDFLPKKEIIATVNLPSYHLGILDLVSRQIEILGVDIKNSRADVYLNRNELNALIKAGFSIKVDENKSASLMLAPDAEYKNPTEIENFVKEMHQKYPDITAIKSIGKSLEGRDIWAIKISDNPNVHEAEPAILFNGMHHAREVMTPEVTTDIVQTLLEKYNSDSKITNWVNSYEIWVVPMLNVDGNNKVWMGESMWRKNVRGGYGVDINRNYPYKWGTCNGSSGSRYSDTFRGASGGSEPETQALMNLVADVRPVFDISFHSYSELVIYPFGCNGEKTPTHEVVANVGKTMADLISYTPGTSWETLYSVDGGDIDWMYAAYQVIPYVIEVNSSREGFQPRYDLWRDKTVAHVQKAWMFLLDRLNQSAIRGIIENGANKNLTIGVEKVTKAGEVFFQDYKVNPDGTFHIILNPGSYKLNLKEGSTGRGVRTIKVDSQRVDLVWAL